MFSPSSEKRLHSMNQLVDHPNSVQYFWPDRPVGHIQDDHIPFLNRGRTQIPHIWSQYRQYSAFGWCHSVPLCQVCTSSTLSPPPSRPCGTRSMTTSRTWIAPPFRTSTRSCRFLFWSTSTPGPPSLQPHRLPCKKQTNQHTLYLMLFKHQQYVFPLITEMWGRDSHRMGANCREHFT